MPEGSYHADAFGVDLSCGFIFVGVDKVFAHVFNHELIGFWRHPCVYERSEATSISVYCEGLTFKDALESRVSVKGQFIMDDLMPPPQPELGIEWN